MSFVPTCLVLDVRLPGRRGLDFQRELTKADIHIPIIIMTGHGDIPMSVQAMKAGAIEFLQKGPLTSGSSVWAWPLLEKETKPPQRANSCAGHRDRRYQS